MQPQFNEGIVLLENRRLVNSGSGNLDFHGRLMRFYTKLDGQGGFYLPSIRWKDGAPELTLRSIPEEATIIADEEAEQLWVLADIGPVLDGDYFRRLQQAVSTIAITNN